MLKRVDHIGVVVDDLKHGRAFLESIGFEHLHDLAVPERGLHASFWRLGDVSIELLQMDDPEANQRRMAGELLARIEHIAVEVDDIHDAIRELGTLGVEMLGPPTTIGGNTSVWTRPASSDGYQFQFTQKGRSKK